MSVDWDGAAIYINRNADLNPSQFAKRDKLGQAQAYDTKMEVAIDKGRIYGLGAQKCDISRKRKLDSIMQHPPVSVHW
jgi:hypothetical protein